MAEFATPHDYPDEYDHPIGSEPGFDETEIGDALTADGGDDALIDDCLPDDDTSSDAKGRDPSNIAEGEHERPFTIVEFGAGIAPILMHRNAPDVQQLFRKGGRYMALDATPSYVKTGRETSQLYIDVYSSPGVEVEAHFMHAAIHADTPLPPEVALGSADRVVL
ncbi:MAG TPA: hypothetical protein VFM05_09175, partial [Candidatus Saccharimonadales bacterium]|nr:hypothetical protein [Candidatus Saccharimonadales bacterium]